MGENKKAHKYPKQIFDAKKGNKSGSQTLAVEDKLSAVDETANATYLEILHPAAVYRVSILNKNDETKQTRVVKANIRPEHLTRMWMRIQMAEQKLFEMETSPQTEDTEQNGIFRTAAFTEKFMMSSWKNRSPGEILLQAVKEGPANVQKAVEDLRKQRSFLESKLSAYPKNRNMMDAIDMAIQYSQEGKLNNVTGAVKKNSCPDTVMIYDPPEKTFRTERKVVEEDASGNPTKYLVNAYKIQIAILPQNTTTNYKIYILNQFVETVKDGDLEKIVHLGAESPYAGEVNRQEATYYLTSDEMVEFCEALRNNLDHYKSVMYTPMRKKDENIFYTNRQQAKQQY